MPDRGEPAEATPSRRSAIARRGSTRCCGRGRARTPRFRINFQNCVHCKTCDIKDPIAEHRLDDAAGRRRAELPQHVTARRGAARNRHRRIATGGLGSLDTFDDRGERRSDRRLPMPSRTTALTAGLLALAAPPPLAGPRRSLSGAYLAATQADIRNDYRRRRSTSPGAVPRSAKTSSSMAERRGRAWRAGDIAEAKTLADQLIADAPEQPARDPGAGRRTR